MEIWFVCKVCGCPICGTLCSPAPEGLGVGDRPRRVVDARVEDPAEVVIGAIALNVGADAKVGASELPQPDLHAQIVGPDVGPEREVGGEADAEIVGKIDKLVPVGVDALVPVDVKTGSTFCKALTSSTSPPESFGKADPLAGTGGCMLLSFAILSSSAGGGEPPGLSE